MSDGIVVAGVAYPVLHPTTQHPIPVFAWNDPPGSLRVPEFRAGDGYNKRRTQPIDLCVVHWTGGEAEPDRMAETLRKRKLGVEFAISRLGNVFQFCDPAYVDTADAGTVNNRSVGIEVVSYGYAGGWAFDPVRAVKVPRVPPIARDRVTYPAVTHGRKVQTAMFYPAQIAALCGLADALTAALPAIQREVPPLAYDGSVYGPALLRGDSRFAGFVGHYHLTTAKRDPGPLTIEALRLHFNRANALTA